MSRPLLVAIIVGGIIVGQYLWQRPVTWIGRAYNREDMTRDGDKLLILKEDAYYSKRFETLEDCLSWARTKRISECDGYSRSGEYVKNIK